MDLPCVLYGGRRAGCKSYLANSLFVFGEFEQARKHTPKIVNTISRGIDVREHTTQSSQTLCQLTA